MADGWSIGKRAFTSRLLVGTGKYADFPTMQRALAASGAELVTVAGLLAHLGIKVQRVAVEVNEAVVTKDRYDAQPIGPGDSVEIVAFVGGG